MSRNFEVRGKMVPWDADASWMKAWYSNTLFDKMECFPEEFDDGAVLVYFYPEPADLRKRLAVLERDRAPIIKSLREWYSSPEERKLLDVDKKVPWVLAQMRRFVDCYEQAFASKTEWEPVYRFAKEPDDDVDCMPCEVNMPTNYASMPAGEILVGEPVQWGGRELTERPLEKAPCRRHRQPYIILI